ncbi:hypothetical protein FHT80_006357 [Rhizobium sp. BK226]|nr:hypothetical protein [Rhizobium sp. BK226]
MSDIIGRRGQKAKLGVDFGVVVKPTGKPAQLASLHEPRERLIDRRAGCNVEEITRRIYATASGSPHALHDPIGNKGNSRFHMSENTLSFSDIQGGAHLLSAVLAWTLSTTFFQMCSNQPITEVNAHFADWSVDNGDDGVVFHEAAVLEEPQKILHNFDVTIATGKSDRRERSAAKASHARDMHAGMLP